MSSWDNDEVDVCSGEGLGPSHREGGGGEENGLGGWGGLEGAGGENTLSGGPWAGGGDIGMAERVPRGWQG